MGMITRLRDRLSSRHSASQPPLVRRERMIGTYYDNDKMRLVVVELPPAPRSVPPASGKRRKAHCNGRCAEGRPCR